MMGASGYLMGAFFSSLSFCFCVGLGVKPPTSKAHVQSPCAFGYVRLSLRVSSCLGCLVVVVVVVVVAVCVVCVLVSVAVVFSVLFASLCRQAPF